MSIFVKSFEVNPNLVTLIRKNKHELLEMKNVLTKTEIFWTKNPLQDDNLQFSKCWSSPFTDPINEREL